MQTLQQLNEEDEVECPGPQDIHNFQDVLCHGCRHFGWRGTVWITKTALVAETDHDLG